MTVIGVTGGSGFIGSYVVSELLSKGYEVVIFDRHAEPGKQRQSEGLSYFFGDVRDSTAVVEFAAHVDGIVHLAAVLGTQETIQNPRPSAETNILGGLNVFEAAVQYDIPVVYAGVGNHWMRTEGSGAYTITKTAVEDFTKMYNKFRGGRINVVRPVNAYGPGQSVAAPYGSSKVRKIVPSLACRALLGDDMELYGGGVQISDCVYVEDAASVFVLSLERLLEGREPGEVFEVGPSKGIYTVRDIAEIVRDYAYSITGLRSNIVELPMRPGEVPGARVSADIESLRVEGMNPEELHEGFRNLHEGIGVTVQWYYHNWLPEYAKTHDIKENLIEIN